ncbi:MAG: DNA-methyltransferase [Caldisericum sp.]
MTRDERIVIINDDFLTTNLIPPNSIDLIITSPPYNVDIHYETFKDNMPYEKYLEFTEKWLRKALELVKPDGRMCLNIPLDKSKGRKEEGFQSVYADVIQIAKKVGWKYFSTIIWNESNISRRTAWGSWLSARAPYVIAPVEVIVILYKDKWKKMNESGISDITRDEFIEWTSGIWSFSGENRKKIGHPAPFPLELPKRCIKLFSFVGDTVLDPFLGSGTTLLACALLNRRGIGVEIDRKYCGLAKKRLIYEGKIFQRGLAELIK